MKYTLSCFLATWIFSVLAIAPTPLETLITDTLSSSGIILDHTNNPKLYRLGDAITRAETVGIGLKAAQIQLPDDYFCKNYFRDVKYDRLNNWVCRAIEMGADANLITRTNDRARPGDPVTRIEALAIIMRAGRVPYEINVERKDYPNSVPQWQVDILE